MADAPHAMTEVALRFTLNGRATQCTVPVARTTAHEAFKQLPASFADPVVTHSYAVAAGTALLSRQLAGAAHG